MDMKRRSTTLRPMEVVNYTLCREVNNFIHGNDIQIQIALNLIFGRLI